MNFDFFGTGTPLVLVSGLGCDARMWGAMLDNLPGGYRVVVPHAWEVSTLEEAADGIAARFEKEGLGKAIFAGLSMGGYVVMETLKRYPELFKAAVLMDTTIFPDDAHRLGKREQVLTLLEAGKFEEVLAPFINSVLYHGGPAEETAREHILKMCRELGADAYARSMRAIRDRGGYVDAIKNARVPLLFLAGEHDALTPPDRMREMAEMAWSAHFALIPDAAHMSAVENPAAVAQVVAEFLKENGLL